MENEIMTNETVEVLEANVKNESKKGVTALLIAAGVGVTALVATFIHKKLIKPIFAKIKAGKNQSTFEDTDKNYEGGKVDSDEAEETEE